jgi:chitodextrinase
MKRAEVIILVLIISLSFFSGCIFPESNLPPEPNLRASSTFIDVGEAVTFSANDSYDEDGNIVSYYWDFDDGENAASKYVEHDYEKGGNYTVILIITDNDGKKAVQTMTIHVNELPKPSISLSSQVYIHESVYFWANDTYDPDGYIKDYFWDFGDGSSATGHSVTHIYTEKDIFNVTLTVTDNDGAKNATLREFQVKFRTYEVKWEISNFEVFSHDTEDSGELPLLEGNSEIFPITITKVDITKLVFDLTWLDDKPDLGGNPNDVFTINITSPSPEIYNFGGGPETDQRIIVNVPRTGVMNQIPEDIDAIEAESEDILEKELALNYTGTNGTTDDWTVNITLLDAPGAFGGPFDLQNHWTLTVTAYFYTPVITRK